MHFTHIFLFTLTSKSSIDINAISIINNQQCMNHKDVKIIKIKLFVNNVACFTDYLANAIIHMLCYGYNDDNSNRYRYT